MKLLESKVEAQIQENYLIAKVSLTTPRLQEWLWKKEVLAKMQ